MLGYIVYILDFLLLCPSMPKLQREATSCTDVRPVVLVGKWPPNAEADKLPLLGRLRVGEWTGDFCFRHSTSSNTT